MIGNLIALISVSIPIVWIVMHYSSQKKESAGFSEEDAQKLDELMEVADSMAERIKTLESILDAETPEWRDNHGET